MACLNLVLYPTDQPLLSLDLTITCHAMAGEKILVLGGTGPAGICLLRELVARKHATVAFCRNPAKIPEDLVASGQLEV